MLAQIAILLCGGFLALTISAQAAEFAIVAKRTIYPGQIIDAADLKSVKLIRQPQIRYRFVSQARQIIGQQAKRTILPGRFIRIGSAQPAPLVKAGMHKRVQFTNGALAISIVCVALSDASAGDTIRMRNPSSGKIFSAEVQADGSLITGAL
ncbi:MAG: flagellar basal body P-ring formation chaperone FlgA [Rhizobiaceae bacterium]